VVSAESIGSAHPSQSQVHRGESKRTGDECGLL